MKFAILWATVRYSERTEDNNICIIEHQISYPQNDISFSIPLALVSSNLALEKAYTERNGAAEILNC